MKRFFDGADAMTEAMASASTIVAQGVPIEALVFPSEPISVEDSTQDERVVTRESAPILVEIPIPIEASQTMSTCHATPPIISASDPFISLSHAMKDGSSLVVTPSSIPSFVTIGPNADLSSDEGFEKVFEDSDDEPVMKTRVSNSDEDSGGDEQEAETMGICPLLPLGLLFLLFLLFLYVSLYLLRM